MHDLVIRGGTVIDGTGAPAVTADVAVSDGTITEVGRVDGPSRRTFDADGLLARRDHRRPRQLRRRVRTRAPGPAPVADRADGGRGGHPRHRAGRGHPV